MTVFPDKEQGLELLGEPELVYKHGGVTGNGNLMAPSKEVAYDIITAYNFYGHTEFGDSKSYDGRITEILPPLQTVSLMVLIVTITRFIDYWKKRVIQ